MKAKDAGVAEVGICVVKLSWWGCGYLKERGKKVDSSARPLSVGGRAGVDRRVIP